MCNSSSLLDQVFDASRCATGKLEQRLALYDSKRHGGEQMATSETRGAERW